MKEFNLFDSDITSAVREKLARDASKRRKNPKQFKSFAEFNPEVLPLEILPLQLLFGLIGLRGRTMVEIIGSEGIGKTTLTLTLLGGIMRACSSPCLYVNSEGENKMLSPERILRCLSKTPSLSNAMLSHIVMESSEDIKETADFIENWILKTRETLDEMGGEDVPIVVAIDTLSKILSPEETSGLEVKSDDASKKDDKKKFKELGESSPLKFANLMQAWCRRLPVLLEKNNVLMIIVSHQNIKIDMSGFGGQMSAEVSAGFNKTKRGGSATNQNAALQVTLKYTGMIKNTEKKVVGKEIEMRVVKSSVGADMRTMRYKLVTDGYNDTDDSKEMAIDWSWGLGDFIIDNNIADITVSRNRYSSAIFDFNGLTSEELYQFFRDNEAAKTKLFQYFGVNTGVLVESFVPAQDDSSESKEESSEITSDLSQRAKKRRGRKPKSELESDDAENV